MKQCATSQCHEPLDVMLITMKAMNSVTAVDMNEGGEQPLWNTSHWTFTRNILGLE
jgi:hypothetical protein